MKKILVACGCGIATSTIVCDRLEELLEENNINAHIIQCKISEVASMENDVDLILSTTALPMEYKKTTLNAMDYVVGINIEELDQEILDALK